MDNISPAEVKRLSQEEGLYDYEIAKIMGYHRASISRVRSQWNIPRPNLRNRKDKVKVCKGCGSQTLLRRKERITKYCPACREKNHELLLEQKRLYMRNRQK